MNESTGNSYVNLHGYVHGIYFSDFVREGGLKMGMTIEEAIKRYKDNAEYERTHDNLQGCLEFRQLAKWLEELRAYRNMYHADNVDNCLREEVVEDGNDRA